MLEQRYSDNDASRRDIPSFIEPRPPLIQNPFMRPRPQKGTNLLELFEEDSEIEEPEWLQVYLRLKPCKVPNTLYEVRSERCLVTSLDTATAGHGRRTQHNVSKMYTFSKIFGAECNQKEIFESVVKENLRKLPDGQNFTLLTYGASGSGKTYTLMGTVGAPGLVPRSLEYVFRLVDAAQQPAFRPAENGAEQLSHAEQDYELQWVKRLRHVSAPLRDKYRRMSAQLHSDLTASSIDLANRIRHYVWVSFVEIYNEAVYDLLAPPEKRTKLRIREDSSGNVYVKGATQAFVRSGEEAYDVMVAGRHNLVVAATGVHAHSSRSHCIFTITMLTDTGSAEVRTSYVRLCDLAGCERARATRNTGARMAESRAINSSLHVLERCLHMLRRKQKTKNDAMVPYRESKLTRLLGMGLSGARGEAVSMVVTLNPAPQYAHETKHVLSLAAVAQDIQVNNTMLASTLESSTQETTISSCSSVEVMKLRADNERLHFELVQAQARNKELLASMEERQQESANTMWELVEEAKDMTKQYYEAQLEALRCQMEDMAEEYESRLAKKPATPTSNTVTPSRHLQNKVAQLMTEIAVLEEKLTAEHLARARAEKEVEHLRTCIEERDEKAFKDATPPREDVLSLSDSENESDEETSDPFNESLEPTFKKELNRSISIALQNEKRSNASIHTINNIDEGCDSDLEKSHETLQNDDDSKNSTYATGEDEGNDLSENINLTLENGDDVSESFDESTKKYSNLSYNNEKATEKYDESLKNDSDTTYDNEMAHNNKCDNSLKNNANVTYDNKIIYNHYNESLKKYSDDDNHDINVNNDVQFKNESMKSSNLDLRGTYFISDKSDCSDDSKEKNTNSFRGTYFVKDPLTDVSKSSEPEVNEPVNEVFKVPIVTVKSKFDIKAPENIMPEMIREKSSNDSLENQAAKYTREKSNTDMHPSEKLKTPLVSNLNREKSNLDLKGPENIVTKVIIEKSNNDIKVPENQSKKYIREKSNTDMRPPKNIKTPLVSNLNREKSNVEMKVTEKVPETVVSKIIRSFKSNQGSDVSLRQFEQLEKASKECNDGVTNNQSAFSDIKILKEKRTYFDNESDNDNIHEEHRREEPAMAKEKRTYFDNIGPNIELPNKRLNQLMQLDDERSPSIVKDVFTDEFEPSTIKMLLGDTSKPLDVISSIHKKILTKKQDSIDIFDGLESPSLPKQIEKVDNVEIARQSIEKMVINQQSAKKAAKADTEYRFHIREVIESENGGAKSNIKIEIELEPMSSIEETKESKVEIKKEKCEPATSVDNPNQTMNDVQARGDSTIEEFENIYKDITAPRATEFDLLLSQEVTESTEEEKRYKKEVKYNLRKKHWNTDTKKKNKESDEVLLAESHAKCESKVRRRPLRLRRKKNQDEESDDKLKDIVNLQSEFSDVTLDVPAPQKDVTDLLSPEKGSENLPPPMGIQSCPSKSVTRSRRKLFTPRAEPLEESLNQTGDSNERVYVPRPSYHRPRARRKL